MSRDGRGRRTLVAPEAFLALCLSCAGAPRKPAEPPALPACPPGAACYDFERDVAGLPPAAPWTAKGPLVVDGVHTHGGKQAVHVSPAGKDASAFFSLREGFPRAGNAYWGRVMIWADSFPPGKRHFTLIQSTGTVPGKPEYGKTYYTVGAEGNQLITNYDTEGVKSDCWKFGAPLPTRKWICLEWRFDGARDEIGVWVDGVEDAAAHVRDGRGDGCIKHETADRYRWTAPTFVGVDVGYEVYGRDEGHDLWFDDLALGAQRIGCPAR
jgi:hypothetical protein